MDREEALDGLAAADSDMRLRAARTLARVAEPADEEVIRSRRRFEPVPWVRAALEQALARLASVDALGTVEPEDDEVPLPDPVRQYMVGLQVATDRIVHELRSIVGTLRYWAQKENPTYEGSQTERQIERLRQCLEAIDLLGKVATSPASDEFDLSQLIDDEAAGLGNSAGRIEKVGRTPYLVRGDIGIIRLVLRNALANAVEAAGPSSEVHVNWGETPEEYWLAIFDRGPGLPGDPEALFDFGSSTKEDHVGAGLAIVAQAAVALAGKVALTEEADETTKFEFRWPRPGGGANADPSG
jgi:signal transduction histidine kinase